MNARYDQENPRLEMIAEPCLVTHMVGQTEMVCILPAHDDGKKTDQFNSDGRPARWRRHWFVARFPYREL